MSGQWFGICPWISFVLYFSDYKIANVSLDLIEIYTMRLQFHNYLRAQISMPLDAM